MVDDGFPCFSDLDSSDLASPSPPKKPRALRENPSCVSIASSVEQPVVEHPVVEQPPGAVGDPDLEALEHIAHVPPKRGGLKQYALLNRAVRGSKGKSKRSAEPKPKPAPKSKPAPHANTVGQAPDLAKFCEHFPFADKQLEVKLISQGDRPALVAFKVASKQIFQVSSYKVGSPVAKAVARLLAPELSLGTLSLEGCRARRAELLQSKLS